MGLALIALSVLASGAAAIADTFGTGGNQFTLDFTTTISGASNPTTGYGIVNNDYRMGKFEISNDQWTKFKAAYGPVAGDPWYAYDASPFFKSTNVPMNNVSWYQAAQFVNWLNTSNNYQAAYNFTGTQGTNNYTLATWNPSQAANGGTNLYRNKNAVYFLPTEDEWVKAAYWKSTLQTYATSTTGATPTQGSGTGWNFYNDGYATTTPGPWNVGVGGVGSGSQELNGTYDMMGNVWEWTESPLTAGDYGAASTRALRGGSYQFGLDAMASSTRGNDVNGAPNGDPSNYDYDFGFRVASVVPPATLTWTGSVNGTWDVSATANFSSTSGKFNNSDLVAFNDSGNNTTITIAAGGVAPGSVVFSNTIAKSYTLSGGPISGTTSLQVSGGGTVTLNSANTYTGGTTVSSGTLVLGVQGAVPDNTALTISGGTLNLGGFTKTTTAAVSFQGGVTQNGVIVNNGSAYDGRAGTVSAALQGTAGLSKTTVGTLTLSGANTYTGATTVSAGILKAGIGSVLNTSGAFGNNSAVTLADTAGAALDIAGYNTQIGSLAGGGATGGNVTLGANTLTTGGNNTTTTYAGVISSSAGVTGVSLNKIGTGRLTLQRVNTYTGKSVIDGGTLAVDDTNNIDPDGKFGAVPSTFQADNITIKNGGTLYWVEYHDYIQLNANRGIYLDTGVQNINSSNGDFYLMGVISGPGGLLHGNIGQGGYRRLCLFGANTFTGDTKFDGTGSTSSYGGIEMSNALALQYSAFDTSSVGAKLGNPAALVLGGLVGTVNLAGLLNTPAMTSLTLQPQLAGVTKTYSGVIAGAAGMTLTKNGLGTQELNGLNTYTGVTTISAGTLIANKIVVSGSNSSLGNAASAVVLGDASNQGTLSYTGGVATYTRGFTVNAGGGQLTHAGTGLLTVSTGGITAGGLFTVGGAATKDIAITSVISSTGGLTKTDADTVTLSGANTYTGATTITAGILKAGIGSTANINGAFGNNSAVTLADVASAAMDITSFSTQIGSLAGGGTIGGNVTLGAATLTVGGDNTSTTYSGVISSTGSPTTSLIKIGTGTQTLSGANSYTGVTTISAGTLKLGAAGSGANTPLGTAAAGTTVATNAALDLNGFTLGTAESLTIVGTGVGTTGALTNSGGAATYSGVVTIGSGGAYIGGSGDITLSAGLANTANALTKVGASTLTLSAPTSRTGATTISGGKLTIASTGAINSTSAVSIGAGEFNYNSATPLSKSVSFSGTGGTLSGTGTITPAVNVPSGNTLAPGNSIGTLSFGTGLTIAGAYAAQLGTPNTAPAAGVSDRIAVTGNLTLTGGTLSLSDNTNADGQGYFGAGAYRLATFTGTRTGTFSTVTKPLASTLHESVVYTGTSNGSVDLNVYRLAAAAAPSSPVNLGNVRVGSNLTGSASVTNTASADGFSELLKATVTGDGSEFSGVAGGASGALNYSKATSAAGIQTGSATVVLISTGAGTYADTTLSTTTVALNGAAYDYAQAKYTGATLAFGNVHQGATVASQTVAFGNQTVTSAGYQDLLDVSATTGNAKVTPSSISGLAASAGGITTANLSFGVNTTTVGSLASTASLTLTSNANGVSGLSNGTATVVGSPAAIATTGYVYSGTGVWNTDGNGNWNDTSKWTDNGGAPGLDAWLHDHGHGRIRQCRNHQQSRRDLELGQL